jgi:transposase InsO family protein
MADATKRRRPRRHFDDDFKAQAVRLVLDDGKTVGAVARDLDLTETALGTWVLRTWVARARADRTQGKTGLTTVERGESGTLYLAAILDLFSRCVVGWAVSAVNDRHLTLAALTVALNRRCPETGLLHHSDRGSTYASDDYQDRLTVHGITCSMSRTGDCYDNAVMEAFFSTLKTELADHFDSHGEAKRELFDYIDAFYNTRRRHSTLDYVSPAEYERRFWSARNGQCA